MAKLGKGAANIFEKSTPTKKPSPTTKAPRGRPTVHKEAWSKVTVVLLDKQVAWLDRLAADIKVKTRKSMSRAEIIRGILAAVEKNGFDLTEAASEEAITKTLQKAIKRRK